MDSVRSGPFGQIFRPDNFIFGQVGHSPACRTSACSRKWLLAALLSHSLSCRGALQHSAAGL